MADFITHYLAGNIYYLCESEEVRASISARRAAFNWGTQGPDLFYFHNYDKRDKTLVKIGKRLHKNDVNALLAEMQTAILNESEAAAREIQLAYLLGFITHYHVDGCVHPYIKHLVNREIDNGSRSSVSAIHVTRECLLGCEYYKALRREDAEKFAFKNNFKASEYEFYTLERMWRPVIKNMYGYDIPQGALLASAKNCLRLIKPMHRARRLVAGGLRGAENLRNVFGFMSGKYRAARIKHSILNTGNCEWEHPEGTRSNSFSELIDEAVWLSRETAAKILKAINNGIPFLPGFINNFDYGF